MNMAQLIGRLGADPTVRVLPSGDKAASFRVATDEFWKNEKGETVKRTEWHSISVFGKLAVTAEEYLKKGRLVYLQGRLHTRQWDDKNGVKRFTTEIVANTIRFLGPRDDSKPAAEGEAPAAEGEAPPVPF